MRIAVLSDIHANRDALEACLADARERKADRLVFLGDYVGYGPDPEAALDLVMAEAGRGAIALLGNHDEAVDRPGRRMNDMAEQAIAWTRGRLEQRHRDFIAGLPLTAEIAGMLLVHADAAEPARWTYVTGPEEAARSMRATHCRLTICGHVHRPAIYAMSGTGKLTSFRPVPDVSVPLAATRSWLVVNGAVGQPRDGNPAAAYLLIDVERSEVTLRKVPYDVEAVVARIDAVGLPAVLGTRLRLGE